VKITDALKAEHRIYLSVFKQIEEVLPSLASPLEIQTMARVVESILREHGQRETQLAFLALDHVRAQKGPLTAMHQDHREIDTRLIQVHRASTCSEGRRLLKAALVSSREHFQMEEENVFPLIELSLSPESLEALGRAWLEGSKDITDSPVRTADRGTHAFLNQNPLLKERLFDRRSTGKLRGS
jgi:hemerythrin-like domain-containing protein